MAFKYLKIVILRSEEVPPNPPVINPNENEYQARKQLIDWEFKHSFFMRSKVLIRSTVFFFAFTVEVHIPFSWLVLFEASKWK